MVTGIGQDNAGGAAKAPGTNTARDTGKRYFSRVICKNCGASGVVAPVYGEALHKARCSACGVVGFLAADTSVIPGRKVSGLARVARGIGGGLALLAIVILSPFLLIRFCLGVIFGLKLPGQKQ
jgi:ribosomal protein S27E